MESIVFPIHSNNLDQQLAVDIESLFSTLMKYLPGVFFIKYLTSVFVLQEELQRVPTGVTPALPYPCGTHTAEPGGEWGGISLHPTCYP